jgi:hypothetical protein
MAENAIPKARDLFRGDINEAVIRVQKIVGIEISPDWWEQHVGNAGSSDEILSRFDRAYEAEVDRQKNA